jgi:AcrR family transcriptional regulator
MNVHSRRNAAQIVHCARLETHSLASKAAMQLLAHGPEQRSDEILQSIRGMFAEKGFDGASMQDLARAAGMSVGNFYRYFPSKAAIVEAIVNRDLSEVAETFSKVMEAAEPMQALRDELAVHINEHICGVDHDSPLWAEMTAASMRKPEIGAAMQRMEDEIKRYLLAVFAKATGLPTDVTEQRFSAHVALIMMLVKGSAMMCQPARNTDPGLQKLILRTMDGVLAEVSALAVKG